LYKKQDAGNKCPLNYPISPILVVSAIREYSTGALAKFWNLINSRNVLRQIVDIQVQADRLIKGKADLSEIEDFAKYSYELKTYLYENIQDDLILKYVREIPTLTLDDEINDAGFIDNLLYFFGGLFGGYSLEQKKQAEALDIIRDIKGKYASAEFMLKNYFE
jgi:hypothetical protein